MVLGLQDGGEKYHRQNTQKRERDNRERQEELSRVGVFSGFQ